MGEPEVPPWLKALPLAPEYHPTEAEFADPIAYILKIEEEASQYGVCKIVPPYAKASKKTVAFHLNRSLALSRENVPSSKIHGSCPSMSRSMGGVMAGPQLVKQKSLSLDVSGTDSSGRAKFDTRRQQLGWNPKKTRGVAHSQTHKLVWESGEKYTLEQFEQKAKIFARQRLGTCRDPSPLSVESLFWRAAADKPISVEYANDIPGSAFAEPLDSNSSFRGKKRKRIIDEADQAFGTVFRGEESYPDDESLGASEEFEGYDAMRLASGAVEAGGESGGGAGGKLANSAWNMRNVARSQGSLLRYMPDEVPGVTSPMVYIGMLFSWFAWHVEDHELHSLNYLHTGASKTWYAVPGDAAPALEEAVRVHGYGGQLNARAAFSLLGEKTTVMSPEVLVAAGVPCCRLVQNAGEYVVTFPRAYHLGFSHGFNCGEAANFATPGWLDVAKDAAARRAAMNYLPMLSHQQLLYLLTMSLPPRMLASSPSEPRSSRLKVRKKSPGEEMVKTMFVNDVIHNNRLLGALLDKGLPCCLLAKDAVNHGTANMPSLEDSDRKSPLLDSSLQPTNIETSHVVDSTDIEAESRAGTSVLVQTEDVYHRSHVSPSKLAVSTPETILCNDVVSAEGGHDDLLPKDVDQCAPSETGVCSESKATQYYRALPGSTSALAIDWGILPCAACGILCYATMAVVEPSSTASMTFKPLPVKPIPAVGGLSNSIREDGVLGTNLDSFASEPFAAMNQDLDLSRSKLLGSGQAAQVDRKSEYTHANGMPTHISGYGILQNGSVEDVKKFVIPDNESKKEVAHVKTSALANIDQAEEQVEPSRIAQVATTDLEKLEGPTGMSGGSWQATTLEDLVSGERLKSLPGMTSDFPDGYQNTEKELRTVAGQISTLGIGKESEVKTGGTYSSLQLLVSTYDDDSSDVEGEEKQDEKAEEAEAEIEDPEADGCGQIFARPDSGGHLLADVVGQSSDVAWLGFNPTGADSKVPCHFSVSSSASYTLRSLVEGSRNLPSVFISGGFAFVEDNRLVDLATLESILNEKKNLNSGKEPKVLGEEAEVGCSASSVSCEENTSSVLGEEKVDDMQEFYRRINSQALTADTQDDDLVLINFESPSDFTSWQPEPSSCTDEAAGPNREVGIHKAVETLDKFGRSNLEPVRRMEVVIKSAVLPTPRSMPTPGPDLFFRNESFNICHSMVDDIPSIRSENRFSAEVQRNQGFLEGRSCYGPYAHLGLYGNATDESAVQISTNSGTSIFPSENQVYGAGPESLQTEKGVQASLAGVRQKARRNVGRPRVLCLEHAVEAQKRLQDIGGSHTLIVCHSGFEEYELRAKDIAQELGIDHTWRDVSFSKGSKDEIELVKLAVDVEENDERKYTDWITQLGMLVHPRFTTKESEAFDSFKKVTGAFRAGPFRKGKPGRPPGTSLMAGRLGISRKRVDDPKSHSICRTAEDFEGQSKGSKKKKCMVAGKWCGKVWRVNQVHPLLGGCRSIESSAHIGGPMVSGLIGTMMTPFEYQQNAAAKKRGRQRKMLDQGKDQISEDSGVGPLRTNFVARYKVKPWSGAGIEAGQSATLPSGKVQVEGRRSYDQEENMDNNRDDGCSPLNGDELATYTDHLEADGAVHIMNRDLPSQASGGMPQPMPLATYDPDDETKRPNYISNIHSSEFSTGVAVDHNSAIAAPVGADNQKVGSPPPGRHASPELQEETVGMSRGGYPDSTQLCPAGYPTEPPIPPLDVFGSQPPSAQSSDLIVRSGSIVHSSDADLYLSSPAKDGGSRGQTPGKGAAVWCDVPIASSLPASSRLRNEQSLRTTQNANDMFISSNCDHGGDTGYEMPNSSTRPVKGKFSSTFVQGYGPDEQISIERHQTALKMRKMLDIENTPCKRFPVEGASSEEPPNDVESVTTSKLLGWKRKTDGCGGGLSGKKVKSLDTGKNVKFQEEPSSASNRDKAVTLMEEVNHNQELCESSCHPENELEQFDYDDDGSQHTLRDIKYVYGVSDCRGEFLAQGEGFGRESTNLQIDEVPVDEGSCFPVMMLESHNHDSDSQKLQKNRAPLPSGTQPSDDSGQCASGVHPLDLLPHINSIRKPLGKTRGKRSKPLKQIWTSLKHSHADVSVADKSGGKREGKYDTQVNTSEPHNLQAVQCVEARFEAEDCDRVPEIVDHSLGRASQSTRLRARIPPPEEPESDEDGDEPKLTVEKAKKKGRPKKKKVLGRKPKDEEDKEFQCDLDGCRMSFATEAELGIHKKNRCTFKGCNKRFFMHKYLLQHRRVHQPDRPLKCPWPDCPQSFKWAWARTEHIRVHTGERPYTCPDCEQTFRFVSDFSRHKRNTGHTKG